MVIHIQISGSMGQINREIYKKAESSIETDVIKNLLPILTESRFFSESYASIG